MFERFSRPARGVVTRAVEEARDSGATEVRPEHVLAAMLNEPGSVAVQVLAGLGAPVTELRDVLHGLRTRYVEGLDEDDAEALEVLGIDLADVVRRIDSHLGGRPPRRGHLPFARVSKKSLELALREALRLGDGYIGTEHLLLGMVRSRDRIVLDTLAAFDIDPARLRAAVEEAERRTG